MAKVTGFLEHDRQENTVVSPETRIKNFKDRSFIDLNNLA